MYSHWRGSNCPRCSGFRGNSFCTHEDYLLKIEGHHVQPIERYVHSQHPILHRCNIHGTEWKVKPDNVVHKRQGCIVCKTEGKNAFRRKPYKLDDLYTVHVQGYEPFALDYLLKTKKVNPDHLLFYTTEGKPIIQYRSSLDNAWHTYIPDFYYIPKNRIIEVKSTYTLGINDEDTFRVNCDKAITCHIMGYDYTLLLFRESGRKVDVPKDWFDYPREQLKAYIGDRRW